MEHDPLKNWRNFLVLALGLGLVLGSLLAYGIRIAQTIIPAGSTPEQLSLFLWLFLPGITLLGIYGTFGIRRLGGNPHGIVPKVVMVLILLASAITAVSYLLVASTAGVLSAAFWANIVTAILGLANFAFCLVIWNGYRWGVWCLGGSAFLMLVLKFAGGAVLSSLFEFSAVVVLYFLIRTYWNDMD